MTLASVWFVFRSLTSDGEVDERAEPTAEVWLPVVAKVKNQFGPSPLDEALFSLPHFVVSSKQEHTVR